MSTIEMMKDNDTTIEGTTMYTFGLTELGHTEIERLTGRTITAKGMTEIPPVTCIREDYDCNAGEMVDIKAMVDVSSIVPLNTISWDESLTRDSGEPFYVLLPHEVTGRIFWEDGAQRMRGGSLGRVRLAKGSMVKVASFGGNVYPHCGCVSVTGLDLDSSDMAQTLAVGALARLDQPLNVTDADIFMMRWLE